MTVEMKLVDRFALKNALKIHRGHGERVVFTNGCFDILHLGHVRYLKASKALGDVLLVGLNSDASIRGIKGNNRPINSEKDRAEVLAALACVDYITIFEEPDPLNLIEEVVPDVLVKGADWEASQIVGADLVQGYGGRVVRIPFVEDVSTTRLIERILRVYSA